ncbi:MAG TPA: glycosyltransferase family 1 protein [Phycisphaerales bacterium]|nr:glycosyltransferase family 1 protein [Phycisphaerales bacterium]
MSLPYHILYIQPYAYKSGPHQSLRELVSNLDRTQFAPSVVLQEPGAEADDFISLGAKAYFDCGIKTILRSFSPFRQSQFLTGMMSCAKRIAKLIIEQKVDLVHVNSEACWGGNFAARIAKTPAVSHLHGLSVLSPYLVGRLTMFILNNFSNVLISVSDIVRQSYIDSGARANKIRTVHNGIDISIFDPDNIKPTLKAELDINENVPLVGMIANFDPRKGHHNFVDACKHVLAQGYHAQFVIVGNTEIADDNSYFKQIKEKAMHLGIADSLHYTGLRSDIPNVLASLDVVVQPSLTEAGPIVPIEAMAMKRPLIVTDVEGNSEEVLNGQTGILVPKENPKAMSDAIVKLLKDNDQAQRLGENGRQRVLENFTNKVYANSIQQIYKEVIELKV